MAPSWPLNVTLPERASTGDREDLAQSRSAGELRSVRQRRFPGPALYRLLQSSGLYAYKTAASFSPP